MLKNIRIENFRSFKNVQVHRLRRLNLISGRNGKGKTTLLEAIFLNAGIGPQLLFSLAGFRGDTLVHPEADRTFKSCFLDMDITKVIQINAEEIRKGKLHQRTLRLEAILSDQLIPGQSRPRQLVTGVRSAFRGHSGEATGLFKWKPNAITAFRQPLTFQQPPVQQQDLIESVAPSQADLIYGQFLSPYLRDMMKQTHSQLVSALKNRTIERVLRGVSIVDPDVRDLIPLTEFGQETVYVDKGGSELHPIHVMGSGFNHVLNVCLAINEIERGIVIIDELEDGLYHEIFDKVVSYIIEAAKSERFVQFFIATHSAELIEAFDRVAQAQGFEDLCLINLSDTKDRITYFEPAEFHKAVEMHAEMR